MAKELSATERAWQVAIERYGSRQDVTAIDLGSKYKGGESAPTLALRIHVARKLKLADIPASDIVPSTIEGIPTDVIEATYLHQALASTPKRRGRNAVLRPGVSVAAAGCRAGTLGAIVFSEADGKAQLLSAAHVFVNRFRPDRGNKIVQPALDDGGRIKDDSVASLEGFFIQNSWRSDAAIAAINGSRTFNRIPIGARQAPEVVKTAQPGDVLSKSGRTTGVTKGRVEGRGLYKYPAAPLGVVGFRLRIAEGPDTILNDLTGPGDSGALWYGDDGRVVYGLHCAGEFTNSITEFSIACDLNPILTAFAVSLTPP